jgi:hypothetical protein
MLLFRSEEHLQRWQTERELSPGATFTLEQQWALARAWYADRADPDWRGRTPEEAESVFAGVGLTGSFWELT